MKSAAEQLLRDTYRAFNARDIDTVLTLMHPDVDWPNAWEGGRIRGREALGAYWARQFESITSVVEPHVFSAESGGVLAASVHQMVRDSDSGELLSEARVIHRYWIEDGLIVRMEVLDQSWGGAQSRSS